MALLSLVFSAIHVEVNMRNKQVEMKRVDGGREMKVLSFSLAIKKNGEGR